MERITAWYDLPFVHFDIPRRDLTQDCRRESTARERFLLFQICSVLWTVAMNIESMHFNLLTSYKGSSSSRTAKCCSPVTNADITSVFNALIRMSTISLLAQWIQRFRLVVGSRCDSPQEFHKSTRVNQFNNTLTIGLKRSSLFGPFYMTLGLRACSFRLLLRVLP